MSSAFSKRLSFPGEHQGDDIFHAATVASAKWPLSLRNLARPFAATAAAAGSLFKVQPRQIVYPMRYVTPLLLGDEKADEAFVSRMSEVLGGRYVLPLGRARTGLYLLVRNALTETRRRVVMSPFTIADVVNMVRFAGGEPVFVDSMPHSTNLDLAHLRSLLDDRTACVLLTHYHVSQSGTQEIAALCRENRVKLFEDCAISLGATFRGEPIGGVGDASVFSLSGFKIMNFIWGGFIATRDPALFEELSAEISKWPRLRPAQYLEMARKLLRYDFLTNRVVFPVAFRARRRLVRKGKVQDLVPRVVVESRTLDETIMTRPALGALEEWNRKVEDIEKINAHRREIAAIYDRRFRRICVAAETDDEVRANSSWYNYPIVVGAANRERVYREVLCRGFDVGLMLYPNVHEMEANAAVPGRSRNVSALVREILTLPTHPRITPAYADELAHCVADAIVDAER